MSGDGAAGVESAPDVLLVVEAIVDVSIESEWNRWYDRVHLPEILACPYFQRAARYVSEDGDARKYMTVYSLSSDEAVKTREFAGARGWADFSDKVIASVRTYRRVDRQENDDGS